MSGDSRKSPIPLPRNIGAREPGYKGSYFFKFPNSSENFLADLIKPTKAPETPEMPELKLNIPAPKH